MRNWTEPYGDRRQELVFIGTPEMDKEQTIAKLDACLLTGQEMGLGPKLWAGLRDRSPAGGAAMEQHDGAGVHQGVAGRPAPQTRLRTAEKPSTWRVMSAAGLERETSHMACDDGCECTAPSRLNYQPKGD